MNILAIETSCDETAISILNATETHGGVVFRAYDRDLTHTQQDHIRYGGVFPALAKREHQAHLIPILFDVLKKFPSSASDSANSAQLSNSQDSANSEIKEDTDITKISTKDKMIETALSFLDRESELKDQFKQYVLAMPRPDIDYICVTSGPGLEPALWVGISFAKALGELWNIPVIPVNHMEGHILSVLVPPSLEGEKLEALAEQEHPLTPSKRGCRAPENSQTGEKSSIEDFIKKENATFEFKELDMEFPALALLISGGHTELVLVKGIGDYQIIGKTRDDAVGEAFDKVARMLGLPYPGGPKVSKLAEEYKTEILENPEISNTRITVPAFPRPMMHTKDYDFSFSGLKTAVLYFTQSLNGELSDEIKKAIAYEFEQAVAEVITHKTKKAIEEFGTQTLIVGGGVSANKQIKESLGIMILKNFADVEFLTPVKELSTDNSLMIAIAGYFKIKKTPDGVYGEIKAQGNLSL